MRIIAHRGLVGPERPENTVAAVRAAFVAGADGVEVDVRLSRDGVAVCCHDAHLSRVAGVAASVSTAPWQRLAELRLPGEHRLARLSDVVDTVPDGGRLVVELKPGSRQVAAVVAATLRASAGRIHVTVSSFSPGLLREVSTQLADAELALTGYAGARLEELAHDAIRLGSVAIHPHLDSALTGATRIARLVGGGIDVVPWPVNRPVDVACLGVAGVAGVITDDPVAALAARGRRLTGVAG